MSFQEDELSDFEEYGEIARPKPLVKAMWKAAHFYHQNLKKAMEKHVPRKARAVFAALLRLYG